MTVTLTFTAANYKDLYWDVRKYLVLSASGAELDSLETKNKLEREELLKSAGVDAKETVTSEAVAEKKTRKPKEEKVAEVKEVKAEVLEREIPTYTLQDAIDRAREIAGDGKDEKIMNALKGINTRLGISKVREIPPEKLDGYMVELEKEFPKGVAKPADANMFD